jgi:hypothetical protein
MNSSSAFAPGRAAFEPAAVGVSDFFPQLVKAIATIVKTHTFPAIHLNTGFITGDDKKLPQQRQPKVADLW